MTSNSAPTTNSSDRASNASGRLVAIDLGTRRVGVAVSDESRITARPLPMIERRSWKDLLRRVAEVIAEYDAQGLVIGLPLNMDGSEGPAAAEARRLTENFRRSLSISVYLQDERLTSLEAESTMKAAGANEKDRASRIDSESAAVILRDFMATTESETK